MYIIIYRLHGQLHIDTQYIGTFPDFDSAYDYFCTLPAIGATTTHEEHLRPGIKTIEELQPPKL